jgi:osmotically-inducible protein OsmY
MNIKNVMFAGVIGLMAAAPLAVMAGDHKTVGEKTGEAVDSTGAYVSDAALTTKVKSVLALESELSAIDISVETNKGVVTLTGAVDNDAQVELAEKVVADLDGVKSVDNDLTAP